MSGYDEDLQQEFENGRRPQSDALDARAYDEVFRALGKDPEYQLSSTFADKVVARVVAHQHAKQSKDYFWFGAGVLLLLLSAVLTIMVTGFRFDFGFLSVMSDYKGLAAFGILFVLLLNWIDKRLVRKQATY